MPLSARALLVVLLGIAPCITPPANSQTAGTRKEANASVSGKVTIKGKPAAGIVVGMRFTQPQDSSPTYKATTNQDGVYRITNISSGTYWIAPVVPAMVISELNNPGGQTVVITDGDNAEGIDFDLVRGGVITGTVTDAQGHPLIEMNVTLEIAEPANQRPCSYQGTPYGRTDDRGTYRIFGICPGRYKVKFTDSRHFSRGVGPSPLPMTYYPETLNVDEAKIVEVGEGSEAANIDIKAGLPAQTFSVTGRVIDEAGSPVPNVNIGLSRIIVSNGNVTGSEGLGQNGVSDRQGQFRMNVSSGKYELSVWAGEESDIQTQGPVRFDVLDADVTDLVVKTAKSALVSGVVVFEGTKRPPADLMSRLSVLIYMKSEVGPGSGWAGSVRLKSDGSFARGGLKAGSLSFRVGDWNRNNGIVLTRIERDGVVQPNEIQIGAIEHLTGLRLFVTYSSGTISGVVKIANGTLPAGARLGIQVSRPEELDRGIGSAEVDARGHFLIERLAAGTYELTVYAFIPNSRGRPPMTKQTLTVSDGAVTEVVVTLDLTPPNP